MVVKEIAPCEVAGRMCTQYQFFTVLGALMTTIVSFACPDAALSDTEYWASPRFMLLIPGILLSLQLILIYLLSITETPKCFLANKKEAECKRALGAIYASPARVEKEFDYLQSLKPSRTLKLTKASFQDWRGRKLLYGAAVTIMQQLTGANVILFYTSSFVFQLTYVAQLEKIVATTSSIVSLFFTVLCLLFIDSFSLDHNVLRCSLRPQDPIAHGHIDGGVGDAPVRDLLDPALPYRQHRGIVCGFSSDRTWAHLR